jgi:hypothetical protein
VTLCFRSRSPPLTVASFLFLVLEIPHPAVNTRDVALYQPFRNALRSHNQSVRLPTVTHLMGRCQEGQQNPVRLYKFDATELIFKSLDFFRQLVEKCARGNGPVPFSRHRVGDRDT